MYKIDQNIVINAEFKGYKAYDYVGFDYVVSYP